MRFGAFSPRGEPWGFCVRCQRRQPFSRTPTIRQTADFKRQATGSCAVCGSPMHKFIPRGPNGEREMPGRRFTVKLRTDAKRHLVLASRATGRSQTEIAETLIARHLRPLVRELLIETVEEQDLSPDEDEALLDSRSELVDRQFDEEEGPLARIWARITRREEDP